MKVIYPTKNGQKIYETKKAGFLINSTTGNFLSMHHKNITHFEGFNVFLEENWQLLKTVDYIGTEKKEKSLEIGRNYTKRNYDEGSELFQIKGSSIHYVKKTKDNSFIDIDMRFIYDFSIEHRNFLVTEKDGKLFCKYDKEGYGFFLVIKGLKNHKMLNEWIEKQYSYDEFRGQDRHRYVFRLLEIEEDCELVISFGKTEEEAKNELENVTFEPQLNWNSKTQDELSEELCINSIENTIINTTKRKGIYAGYPWFFQFWARDELICLGGLIELHQYGVVKDILFYYLTTILEDGRLSNMYPPSLLGSADGIGWLFYRLKHLIDHMEEEEHKEKIQVENNEYYQDYKFSEEEYLFILTKLEYSIEKLLEHHVKDGLMIASKLETWMDTGYGGDDREGACIELQAMLLNMFDLANHLSEKLSKDKKFDYNNLIEKTKAKVKEMIRDNFLADTTDDFTIRPNIFIAAYIYPDMLLKHEWNDIIENMIMKMWLTWGGLSSIDVNNKLFMERYTAKDNRSYHRGDSWYWINHIAAIAMNRIDSKKFEKFTHSILHGSKEELFSKGYAGHIAELSSAKIHEPAGCFAQSWSSATFIELIKEITPG